MLGVLIFGLALVMGIWLEKWYRNKPLDKEGHVVLTRGDQVTVSIVVACFLALFVLGQINLYGADNLWIVVTPIVIGIFAFLKYKGKTQKK